MVAYLWKAGCKKMRMSDGICKLCGNTLENTEHLLIKCQHLEDIWHFAEEIISNICDNFIPITYKDIILGMNHSCTDTEIIINMLIFLCKWQIWLRRNLYVFENIYQPIDVVKNSVISSENSK